MQMVQESKLIHGWNLSIRSWLKGRYPGELSLRITINEEGYVYELRVVQGHPFLEAAAVAAVKQWQYSQTFLNGEPVPVIATVTILFNLK